MADGKIRPPVHYDTPRIFVLGLMVYTISVYAATGERLDILDAIRHQMILGVIVLVLSLKSLMDDMPDLKSSKILLILLVALFYVISVQVPYAADPVEAENTYVDHIIKQALFALFLVALIRSPRDMKWLLIAFMFAISWVLAEATRGLFTGSLVWRNQGIRRLHGAVKLYHHPNGLSLIAVTVLPFILYLFPIFKNWIVRVMMLGVLGMVGVCVIYTGSRAGYIGAIAVIFSWWWYSKQRMRGVFIGLAVGVLLIIVLPEQYRSRFLSIGGQEAEGASKDTRIQIMKDAWAVFRTEPLGVGVNSFMFVRNQRFGMVQDVHMLYLQVATHIGVQGFIVFMAFVTALFVTFDRLAKRQERFVDQLVEFARRQRPPPARLAAFKRLYEDAQFVSAVGKAFRLYVIMLLVNGLFAHTLYLICWWFASGSAVALSTINDRLETDARYYRRLAEAESEDDSPGLASKRKRNG